jgi:hypothetical protein
MARIMSIEWNIEEFRRLISEEDPSPAETIDVVSFEIAPSSETHARLPDAEVRVPDTNDLRDLMFIDEAAAGEPKETPTPEVNDAALEIVDHEVVDNSPGKSLDEITNPIVVTDATAAFVVGEGITSEEHLEAGAPETTEQPAALEPSVTPIVHLEPAPPTLFAKGEVTPKSPPFPKAAEGLGIPAGRPAQVTTNTLYRGVQFSTVRCAAGGRWRWSVLVGQPAMLRMGEAATEQQADLNAQNVIDRAIAIEETLRRLKRGDRADGQPNQTE